EDFRENIVKHQSVKANVFLKNFKLLVVEKFDQKEINQNLFIENDWMFKVALYGNALDYSFLKKQQVNGSVSRIIDFIDDKVNYKGAGIEKGKLSKSYPELIGLKIIENDQLTPDYLPIKGLKTLSKED